MSSNEHQFLGSPALGRVLSDIAPIRCFDIGARGGPVQDLNELAWAIEMYGFEPDAAECERQNAYYAASNQLYRKMQLFPVALGAASKSRTLSIMQAEGSSTFLEPNIEVGRAFSRPDYFSVKKTVQVPTMPMDAFVKQYGVQGGHFIKIDVEGLELEIFRSATELLGSTMLAIRSEHYFTAVHHGQPLFQDQASFLSQFQFVPMQILQLQHWRRLTKHRHLVRCDHPIPYSRGQMMHGDILYFRDPDSLSDESEEQVELLIKAAFIAMAYDFVDHAYAIFLRDGVRRYLTKRWPFRIDEELRRVSLTLAHRQWRMEWRRRLGRIKGKIPILNRIPVAEPQTS